MNFYIEFPIKKGSETPHLINLIQQETTEGYLFKFTHNAYGETMEAYPNDEFDIAGGYISFPINSLLAEETAHIRVEWTWYKSSGTILSQEKDERYAEGDYTKNGFEHMPTGLRDITKALVR